MLVLGGYWFFFKREAKTVPPLPAEVYVNAPGFAPDVMDKADLQPPAEGELCTIQGDRFIAELSTRGAALTHFYMTDEKYADPAKDGVPAHKGDISTTPTHERWRSLRTQFRSEGAVDQFTYDRFLWKVESKGGKACAFSYTTDEVKVEKVVFASERPFELSVQTTIKNLAAAPKKHRFSISTHAARTVEEVKGNWGRVSPLLTELTCASNNEITRKPKEEFEKGWFEMEGANRYAAVSNYYFGQALVPVSGPGVPTCRTLADPLRAMYESQGKPLDATDAVTIYTASLVYPHKELAPNEQVTYTQSAFFGPKEREVLKNAAKDAGGGEVKLGDMINLGFFSPVAKFLVGVLVFFHDQVTMNWGLAIILMTLSLRVCLFPLAIPQIKQSLLMRKLRPELDAINLKFKDDAQAKGLATMELHKKHGVNIALGCLPQLVQMPVWWAMYTTLQTAVEMYHTKFLWFADLSQNDKFFILPIVLGGLGFVQAKVMPQQPGQDPQQQKMMMYMMPLIFTGMMFFMPAALGVYMTTNSILGITQQLLVERLAKRSQGGAGTDKSDKLAKKDDEKDSDKNAEKNSEKKADKKSKSDA
jgi:YidC/Oxa1 family membrane protein insertase